MDDKQGWMLQGNGKLLRTGDGGRTWLPVATIPAEGVGHVFSLEFINPTIGFPFTASDTLEFDADSAVGEMHDRIIAGVARRINATLLTRDTQITNSGVVATAW